MAGEAKTTHCNICGQALSATPQSLAYDCGGTCMKCMAGAGDPECVAAVGALSKTTNWLDRLTCWWVSIRPHEFGDVQEWEVWSGGHRLRRPR